MYLPFVLLFVPYWAGLISGGVLLGAGRILMLACMGALGITPMARWATGSRGG